MLYNSRASLEVHDTVLALLQHVVSKNVENCPYLRHLKMCPYKVPAIQCLTCQTRRPHGRGQTTIEERWCAKKYWTFLLEFHTLVGICVEYVSLLKVFVSKITNYCLWDGICTPGRGSLYFFSSTSVWTKKLMCRLHISKARPWFLSLSSLFVQVELFGHPWIPCAFANRLEHQRKKSKTVDEHMKWLGWLPFEASYIDVPVRLLNWSILLHIIYIC